MVLFNQVVTHINQLLNEFFLSVTQFYFLQKNIFFFNWSSSNLKQFFLNLTVTQMCSGNVQEVLFGKIKILLVAI